MSVTDNNPWVEMLARPQGKSTTNIFSYCVKQGEMLSEATDGKITGVFAKTSEVNNLISTSINFSEPLRILADATYLHRAPQVDLRDAGKMYAKHDYCFEVRTEKYRFRLFALVFGPLYPVTLYVDGGVCEDLSKSNGRFSFDEDGEPRPISVKDDDDLDEVFRELLRSKKLAYICNRLMVETEGDEGKE